MKPWQLQPVYLWQRAPFLRITVPFASGILLYDASGLNGISHSGAVALCAASIIALLTLHFFRRSRNVIAVMRQVFIFLAFAGMGWLISFYADDAARSGWYGRRLSGRTATRVRLLEEPLSREKTYKARVQILEMVGPASAYPVTGKALLYFYKDSLKTAPFHFGDTLLVPAEWQPIRKSGNPFEFDYPTFARRANLRHQQFMAADDALLAGRHNSRDETLLQKGHDWSVRQLRGSLGGNHAFGLLQAMLMGDERDFDPALRQTYSETGVIHIVSISGSHTALLFAIIAWAFSWIKKQRWAWVKYAIGVSVVWIYVLMAGAPPSALRSAIMFSVFALSAIINRSHQPFNTLLAAAFALLIGNPMWLFSIGFQLSFLAVLSLLIFYQPLYYGFQRLLPAAGKIGKGLYAACAASIAAEILTAPLVMYYFHNFPVQFLLANLLAGVLLGVLCMIGGLLILAFSWWPPVAGFTGRIISWVIVLFNNAIEWLNGWSPRWSRYLLIDSLQLLVFYCLIGLLTYAWLMKRRKALLPGFGAACVLMMLLVRSDISAGKQHRIVAYNAGQLVYVEEILGKRYSILLGDSAIGEGRQVRDAHIGYRAWHGNDSLPKQSRSIVLNGRKIVLMNTLIVAKADSMNPDILIAGFSIKPKELAALWRTFPADTVVLAGPQKRWTLPLLHDTALAYHIPLHIVGEKGAFILE